MDRRRFLLTSLGGVLAAPLGAGAQQAAKVYRLGILSTSAAPMASDVQSAILPKALGGLGYLEGQNLLIERRYAEGKVDRLPALARELAKARVDAIVAVSPSAIQAAKDATPTIPIVMGFGPPDPVASGFVKSLASPGTNVTGVTYWPQRGYEAKRLELLKEAVPHATRVAFLVVPGQRSQTSVEDVQRGASVLGVTPVVVEVPTDDYVRAFTAAQRGRAAALLVQSAPEFYRDRKRIIALAAKHRMPAMYEWPQHAEDGGLMAYGASLSELYERVASFVDRIFKGGRAAELPIEQPAKLQLVINLKTATALGLTIPPSLLARADQVIE